MATLTIADLDNGKRDLKTVSEVANSRAATTTTRFGAQTTTLYEAIRRIGEKGDAILRNLGFMVPVPYAEGLAVMEPNFTVIGPDGNIYAAQAGQVPFTTGAWDALQWYPIQNDLNDSKLLVFDSLVEAQAAATTLPDGQPIVAGSVGDRSYYRVEAGALVFDSVAEGVVFPEDFGAGPSATAEHNTKAFESLELVFSKIIVDLRGKNYPTEKIFRGNTYINGSFTYPFAAVPDDAVLTNPVNMGALGSARVATALQTKSGLKLATIQGVIQGAVLDQYANILYTLQNESGTIEASNELNKIVGYRWAGQNVAMTPITVSLSSADIGHQCLGLEVLRSGTRSTQGDVRLWSIAGVSRGSDSSKYAVRFSISNSASPTNVEFFKLWGDDVAPGTRVLGTCPDSRILVSTGIRDGNWFLRVFDMAVFAGGPGDYSERYLREFRTQNYNRSLQDVTSDGEFIYLYHGGTAFSSTIKYLEVYSLEGTYIGTSKIQAGALRAWEIYEDGGGDTPIYEPEAVFIARGPYGYELIYGNTNGVPVGQSTRETTFYTLRPNQALHLKPGDSLTPALILDAVHDICFPAGSALTASEIGSAGLPSAVWNLTRDGQSQTVDSGNLTVSYSGGNGSNVGVRVANNLRAGIWQVSGTGSLGLWDSTRAKYPVLVSTSGNITFGGVTLHEGNNLPLTDNTYAVGNASQRYSVIYAATGSINTSDEREKTPLSPLTEAQRAAALEIKASIGSFQFKSGKRTHFGVGAQTVGNILRKHGLNPEEFSFWCYDVWDEQPEQWEEWDEQPEQWDKWDDQYNDEGVLVRSGGERLVKEYRAAGRQLIQEHRPAGNRYGIRYDVLWAFILAAI